MKPIIQRAKYKINHALMLSCMILSTKSQKRLFCITIEHLAPTLQNSQKVEVGILKEQTFSVNSR